MTEKRFAVTQTVLGSGIYDFQAENELCESYDEDAYGEVCKKLNELHEENQTVKDIINELNSMDFYKDSALLDEYLGKIAKILGVDYE